MGHFKKKTRKCPDCGYRWTGHEEKESDVNAAVWLLNEARKDAFDEAFLMTGDSDLAPAVRMLHEEFPGKSVKVIATVGRRHSKELAQAGSKLAKVKEVHLEHSLLPDQVYNEDGRMVAESPLEYSPLTE